MPGPGGFAIKELLTKYGAPIAGWVVTKLGGDWLWNKIEQQADKLGARQKAIQKARDTQDGRFGATIQEDTLRYVVYAGDKPIDIFPAIEGDLGEAMRGYKLSNLKEPDDLALQKARRKLKQTWQRLIKRSGTVEGAVAQATDAEAVSAGALLLEEQKVGEEVFKRVIDEMPTLLERLIAAPSMTLAETTGTIPEAPGVYVFSEDAAPLYVGQTRNLRRRLRQHGSKTSKENQAAFAYNLALREARARGLVLEGTRKQIEADPDFAELFAAARERVSKMAVRFIEEPDPLRRYIFEPYATEILGTHELNSFETH